MDFRDNGTLVLKAETNEFDKRMAELNLNATKLKNTLKDIEMQSGRNNAEYRKTKAELDAARKAQEDLAKEMKKMDLSKMTYQQLTNHIKQLQKELKGTVPGGNDAAAALKRLGEAEKHLRTVVDQQNKIKTEAMNLGQPGLWGKITTGIKGIGTAFQAILALQVIQWFYNIGKSIFDTTGTFEKYEKVLITALGSEKQAKSSMEAIKKMAKETAFGVDELTDGYVKMVNRGLRPSKTEMVALGDLAASQGKTFDQLIEAVLDAQSGENERLKEFGIKARKEGDSVALSFKGQTVTVKQNEEAIYGAIVAMGQMTGVAGQNASMMETLQGKSSNFGDTLDSVMSAIGAKFRPVFVFLLDALASGVEWFGKIVSASDPVLKVFEDLFGIVDQVVGAFVNIFSNMFPKFLSGGNAIGAIMNVIGFAFRAVLTPVQLFIGSLGLVFNAIAGVVQGGKALVQVLQGDFTGAAQSFENAKKNFSNIGTHANETFAKIKKGWNEAFVQQPKAQAAEAVFAAKKTEEGRQEGITGEQKKAAEKREKEREKAERKINELIAQLDAEHNQQTAANALETEQTKIEEKRRKRLKEINDSLADEKTKEAARVAVNRNADAEILAFREKDNKKALELLTQIEAEHTQIVADNSLAVEESKIEEKRRKRLADIQKSSADENTKETLIAAIHKSAEADLEKVRVDYRKKRLQADEEAAKKLLAQNNFVRDQEQKAENALFEWQLSQNKNNSGKTAQIKKEFASTQLRITQDRLQNELAAEQTKAIAEIEDAGRLSAALKAIEEKYHTESLQAEFDAAEKKKAIDKELSEAKAKNLQDYSNMFGALLKGDLSTFVEIAGQKVQGHKAAWQEKLSADMASYEQGAQMATQAVGFLNGLAKARAERAIAEAQRERDQKVAILENEITVTQSLIESATRYTQDLKTAEANRLSELQKTLTSETATEEEKRTALKKYYSENLQDMKAAEEKKIEDLQRLANQAKTEDEKRAIEEKIAMAKKESEEKIRLAEEEYQAKADGIDELTDFSKESSENQLKDAEKFSDKQIKLSEDEAVKKMDMKQDLEDTIASENRKARATEAAEKKKAWQAQKKADIATALITGAIAVLKALANFFPLNIVLAAVAAVATGVQIARIKSQPEPNFSAAHGAIVRGSKHGSKYGDSGIAMIDRVSGREVGEMEGDEAIISAGQTNANMPLIRQMFANARTPGKENTPVMPLAGIPPAFRDGGRFESPYFERGMYLFGTKKKKREAEEAARKAEEEAAASQAEADAALGEYGADTSAYSGIDGSEPQPSTAESKAAQEAAQKQGQDQLAAIKKIQENTGEQLEILAQLIEKIAATGNDTSGRLSEIRSAVNGVENAVNNSNQAGRLDQLISQISNMKAA